nr:hypothetical protein [Mediterraneibacter faecis]
MADFNPQLSDQTDQIEWTCMGTDDKVIDGIRGIREPDEVHQLERSHQSYVIRRDGSDSL